MIDSTVVSLRQPDTVDDPLTAVLRSGEHRVVGPVGLCHEVMQRLVRRLHATGLHAGCHRFDALARAGQQQTRAVRSERLHDWHAQALT